jgi:predicted dienelactone hydrolase
MGERYDWVDERRRHWRQESPRPVTVEVFRPVGDGPHPAVLLSHGTGGAIVDLAWWAQPLADAGFVVIGVNHYGNNYLTGYLAEAFAAWWDRPLDLSYALDRLTDAPYVDLDRVGVAGFSIGGYTAAALLGARVNPEIYAGLGTGQIPSPPTPEFPDLLAELLQRWSPAQRAAAVETVGADYSDKRVRAGFLLAPALGPALEPASLAAIDRPVMVRWGDADDIATPAENAQRYAELIPGASGRSLGADVDHYVFVRDASAGAPVRDTVIADSVAFFTAELK